MMTRRQLLECSALAMTQAGSEPSRATYRFTREIPVEEGYDVVVAGGGPAGAAAAISAGRLGARVLLLEAMGCLGGMGTSGMVMAFCPVADGEKCIAGGLMREIIETLYNRGWLRPGLDPSAWRQRRSFVPFNAEGLKLLLDELAAKAGVEVRFFTTVTDADADPRKGVVNGIVAHNIEGYRYIRARAFIDATGNGVLAKLCGAVCREAGRDTPKIMPPTLISLVTGIDWDRLGNQQEALKRALADKFFSQPDRHLPGMFRSGRQFAFLNVGHVFGLNALSEKSMSAGMVKGRQLVQEYVAFYRKYVAGCENLELVTTAPVMGVRESRRVLGEYELNLADYQARRQFPDQIGVYNYPIDIHVYDTSDAEYERFSKEFQETGRLKDGEFVGLPYGMLVPKGWRNLWVAGRCASMDVYVHGAFRVQPAAVMMGQAAGTAAVQSIKTQRPAAEIDTEALVNTLREAGAFLPQTTTSKRMTRSA